MKVRVRFFASFREKIQREYEDFELNGNATVKDLQEKIAETHPGVFDGARAMVSVNYSYAEPGQEISEGDELAVMPLASGG